MIIGSGMVASALDDRYSVVFYAAGVSNSGCTDEREYERDRKRLAGSLGMHGVFVYFSTASEVDSMYVRHKRAMEEIVKRRGNYLICRASNIAGKTSNPHTILNYLYARIARSEGFDYWSKARRNIIDVRDVCDITHWLLRDGAINETVNVAAPKDHSITDLIAAFEKLVGKKSHGRPVDKGDSHRIDVERISGAPVDFSGDYINTVLSRYYA